MFRTACQFNTISSFKINSFKYQDDGMMNRGWNLPLINHFSSYLVLTRTKIVYYISLGEGSATSA